MAPYTKYVYVDADNGEKRSQISIRVAGFGYYADPFIHEQKKRT